MTQYGTLAGASQLLGLEVAGVVVQGDGPDAQRLINQRVIALLDGGGYDYFSCNNVSSA